MRLNLILPTPALPGNMSAPTVTQASSSALTVEFDPASDALIHQERHAPKVPQVGVSNVETGWWSNPATITTGSNITGLDPLIEYEVQTRGVNGAGNGAWSSSGAASTATATSNKNGLDTHTSPTTTVGNNGADGNAGSAYIDGMLTTSWTFSASPKVISYSFPQAASNYDKSVGFNPGDYGLQTTHGFAGLSSTQQNWVRRALFYYQQKIPIKFVEITESDATHAVLRYAISDNTIGSGSDHAAVASTFFPTGSEYGGDTWLDSGWYATAFGVGNFQWKALIHEIGHGLGLKHPESGSGSVIGRVMPNTPGGAGSSDDHDHHEWTLMSYKPYPQGPTNNNGTWGFPQTLMRLDIAALQWQYGATTHTGTRVHTWSTTTGEYKINDVTQWTPGANVIFQTIWDGGTTDTYDFTSTGYTGITADLDAGDGTSVGGQLADLSNGQVPSANIYNAYHSSIDGANT